MPLERFRRLRGQLLSGVESHEVLLLDVFAGQVFCHVIPVFPVPRGRYGAFFAEQLRHPAQRPVLSNTNGARLEVQAARNLRRVQELDVHEEEKLTVARGQPIQGLADGCSPLFGDQGLQGPVVLRRAGVLAGAAQFLECVRAATRRPALMHADVACRLEKKGWHGVQVADLPCAEGFEGPAERFLRHIFCRGRVPYSTHGEVA